MNPREGAKFHLLQAEEHLAAADLLAAAGQTGDAIPRLLASIANAQIAAVKLSAAMHGMTDIMADTLEALDDGEACPECGGGPADHEPDCSRNDNDEEDHDA